MQVGSVYITGNEGMIGSYLREQLRHDYQVSGCDIKSGVDFSTQEVDADLIIHTAGLVSVPESEERPAAYIIENIVKLGLFLDLNPGKRVIFLSTGGAIYGDRYVAEEYTASTESCLSIYAATKLMGEHLVRHHNPDSLILRLGVVMSSRKDIRSVRNVISHFEQDNPIIVYGKSMARDFVDESVVLKAIKNGINKEISGTYNIGSGEVTYIHQLAQQYGQKRGVPVVAREFRKGEVKYNSLDITEARKAGLYDN